MHPLLQKDDKPAAQLPFSYSVDLTSLFQVLLLKRTLKPAFVGEKGQRLNRPKGTITIVLEKAIRKKQWLEERMTRKSTPRSWDPRIHSNCSCFKEKRTYTTVPLWLLPRTWIRCRPCFGASEWSVYTGSMRPPTDSPNIRHRIPDDNRRLNEDRRMRTARPRQPKQVIYHHRHFNHEFISLWAP